MTNYHFPEKSTRLAADCPAEVVRVALAINSPVNKVWRNFIGVILEIYHIDMLVFYT
jgi:hypothetical protein